jgi:hypothetical protein
MDLAFENMNQFSNGFILNDPDMIKYGIVFQKAAFLAVYSPLHVRRGQ